MFVVGIGIQFLPLDKQSFLKIQSFVNLVEQTFSQIKYTAFLYTDQLVWSGLEQEDMRVLYKYLTTSLFPLHFSDMEVVGLVMTCSEHRWLKIHVNV